MLELARMRLAHVEALAKQNPSLGCLSVVLFSMLHVWWFNLADFLNFVFEVSTRQKCRRQFCVYSLFCCALLLSILFNVE